MNFDTLFNYLFDDTWQTSVGLFGSELVLCATIVALLIIRLVDLDRWCPAYWVALIGTLVSFFLACQQFSDLKATRLDELPTLLFTGLLVYDQFTVFFRLFLLLFLILVIALTVVSEIVDREDGSDFYTLLLGSTIGMMLMVSTNNFLILFLGVEMTSVPSYVMVGFLKTRRLASEAALKYVVYGAGAAGVMLYGTSLLVGLLGTTDLSVMASQLHLLFEESDALGVRSEDPMLRTLALGALMVLVGLAFKLSLVPFHFWCPDAFEGASAEVAGFLSVASKAAAFALLVRFCLALVGNDPGVMADFNLRLGIGLGIVAAITTTFGNLAAYTQTNMKRLLAYSTIAHAGYMLMAVAAMMVILNAPAPTERIAFDQTEQGARCLEGLLYYLAVYLFMNLAAFAIVALIRNGIGSEEIEDYAGLGWQAPILGIPDAVLHVQPNRTSAVWRVFREVDDLQLVDVCRSRPLVDVVGAGRRRAEHGLQPILLPARAQGDVPNSATARGPVVSHRVPAGRGLPGDDLGADPVDRLLPVVSRPAQPDGQLRRFGP